MALPMMTAAAIKKELAELTGISATDIQHVLDEYRNLILDELENSNRVKILNLVQLEPKVKPARKKRMGRNPSTGEEIEIGAKPAEAVVRARVLAEAKGATPSLAKLRSRLTASQTPKKTTKKAAPKPAAKKKAVAKKRR